MSFEMGLCVRCDLGQPVCLRSRLCSCVAGEFACTLPFTVRHSSCFKDFTVLQRDKRSARPSEYNTLNVKNKKNELLCNGNSEVLAMEVKAGCFLQNNLKYEQK
ncbi:uncharacterized protein ACBT57_003737 isoform 1-T1 [Dama dama]